ncbi:hypothetical protein EYB53_023245 [Candidatus Chloroploca sp. M-50]|uniref:Uncharacterized protein n=1 Tax=Candidatus Chloroploca mongolica TaxID=2528176 RepID=A0ABS4DGT3_9CHLR|nr:hypothetical protein [Candidatus Chloroploca mongolica]MBP1468649.1 hypothetical protein [Candidatus Chloroploca mongolica]
MKYQNALQWLIPPIFILTLFAALAGLWPAEGTPYALTTFRGEEVTINARGLYYWDTVSMVAQMQANDLVTLVLGLPLLALSFWLARRGSLRGRLMLAGTLGFILYTYITMCFGAHYNALFLVYVALFSLSLFAFVLVLMSIDIPTLPAHFSDTLPRGWIAGLLFFAAAFLSLAWLSRIAATFAPGAIPALENTTSMFIQAMDLGLIVPVCLVSGILLLRRHAWGYLLASVGLTKFLTLGIAVSLMGLNMARVGVPVSVVELVIFPAMALAGVVMTVILLKHVQ